MSQIQIFDYRNIIALLKEPKAIASVLLTEVLKKAQDLIVIKDKTWENFGEPSIDLYYACNIYENAVEIFKDLDCLSKGKEIEIKHFCFTLQDGVAKMHGFYEALVEFAEKTNPENNGDCVDFYGLLNSVARKKELSVPKEIKDKWSFTNIKSKYFPCSELVQEVYENRRKKDEENYFIVDSLALLRTFSPNGLKLAKETSAKFNLPYKYALPLTSDEVGKVLRDCPDREFRKKVHNRFFEMNINKKWSSEDNIRNILKLHYKEARSKGYSSVCRSVINEDGFNYSEIKSLLDSAQSKTYLAYSSYMEKLEVFAKEKLNIPILRDWDVEFVKGRYEDDLAEKGAWGSIKFDTKNIWKSIYSLIKKIFNITIKELDETKIYVNDKVLGFYKNGQMIGVLYVSTESRPLKAPYAFFNNVTDAYALGDKLIPMAVLSLMLKKGGNFKSLTDIEIALHELGHAIQFFISRTSPSFMTRKSNVRFQEGMEESVIEFPSQWLEDFAYDVDFLKNVLKDGRKNPTKKALEDYINYWLFGREYDEWQKIYTSKVDWVIHKNKACVYNLDEKVRELKKEFGLYTSKHDKALVDFDHFHMKGKFFSYVFSKNLVHIFNIHFANLTIEEKGKLLSDWYLNGSTEGLLAKFREITDIFTYREVYSTKLVA